MGHILVGMVSASASSSTLMMQSESNCNCCVPAPISLVVSSGWNVVWFLKPISLKTQLVTNTTANKHPLGERTHLKHASPKPLTTQKASAGSTHPEAAAMVLVSCNSSCLEYKCISMQMSGQVAAKCRKSSNHKSLNGQSQILVKDTESASFTS